MYDVSNKRAAASVLVVVLAGTVALAAGIEMTLRSTFQRESAAASTALDKARSTPSMPGAAAGVPGDLPAASAQLWLRESWFFSMQNYLRQGIGPEINDQVGAPKAETGKAVRVLVVGDSFLHGTGVADLDTIWARQLQRELDERWGAGTADVEILARDNASTMEQVEWLQQRFADGSRPDVVLFGYVYNDPVPSFRESSVCAGVQDCRPQMPETHPGYRSCLRGESGLVGRLVKNVLGRALPALTHELLSRYCDLDRFAGELGRITQRDVVDDPTASPYWSYFRSAIADLAELTRDIPVVFMPTLAQDSDMARFEKVRPTLVEAGFIIAEPAGTLSSRTGLEMIARRANPVDGHPGPGLTALYAEDAADALGRVVPGTRVQEALSSPQDSAAALIDNFLPTSLTLSDSTTSSVVVTNARDRRETAQFYRELLLHTEHPQQFAPCIDAGAPHARLMFDRSRSLSPIELRHLAGRSLTVFRVGYDRSGTPVRSEPLVLEPGRTVVLPPSVEMTGVLIAPDRSGCSLDVIPSLERFSVNVTTR